MMSTFYEILAVVSWGVLKLKMGLSKIPRVAGRKKKAGLILHLSWP